MRDWLGTTEQEFTDLCEKWKEIFKRNDLVAEYGWDSDAVTGTMSAIHVFLTARAAYRAANTTDNRRAKDAAMKKAKSAVRDFANTQIRFNKRMSDEDKMAMGVRVSAGHRTNHPSPESQSDTVIENTANHYEHKLCAVQSENHSKVKPADAHGVEYAIQIGGTRPASGADISKSKFRRGTSLVVVHSEADKGKPCYYATRYVNEKGDGGPWSPVVEAYIG